MTLLERVKDVSMWDNGRVWIPTDERDELMRALAIAQAVDEALAAIERSAPPDTYAAVADEAIKLIPMRADKILAALKENR